ncbi:MAG: hypothetical protein ACLR23_23185 [Clostridia bacterium]
METEIKDPDVKSDAEMKRGFVEFKNVSFQYPGAEEPTLRTSLQDGTGTGDGHHRGNRKRKINHLKPNSAVL